MNIKPILRYQFHSYLRIFAIVYSTILGLEIFSILSSTLSHQDGMFMFGLDCITIFTIFISALGLFKESFHFFISAGVSRKCLFTGTVSSLGLLCCLTALFDCINELIFSHFISYCSAYNILFYKATARKALTAFTSHSRYFISYTPAYFFKHYLWCILAYFTFAMIGLFIAVLYYRMNRIQKIWVSVTVPSFSFLLLPILDQFAARGKIGEAFSQFFSWWMSFGAIPLTDLATRIPLIAVIMAITYCMVRKAEVKA